MEKIPKILLFAFAELYDVSELNLLKRIQESGFRDLFYNGKLAGSNPDIGSDEELRYGYKRRTLAWESAIGTDLSEFMTNANEYEIPGEAAAVYLTLFFYEQCKKDKQNVIIDHTGKLETEHMSEEEQKKLERGYWLNSLKNQTKLIADTPSEIGEILKENKFDIVYTSILKNWHTGGTEEEFNFSKQEEKVIKILSERHYYLNLLNEFLEAKKQEWEKKFNARKSMISYLLGESNLYTVHTNDKVKTEIIYPYSAIALPQRIEVIKTEVERKDFFKTMRNKTIKWKNIKVD